MDFFAVLGVVFRRWKVTVPVFVVGMVVLARIVSGVGTEYESFGTAVVLPPSVTLFDLSEDPDYEDEVNVYLENPGSTRTLASTVPIAVGGSPVRSRAAEAGLSPNYEIEVDDAEPILYITAKGETAAQSSDTLDFVLFEIARELAERQDATEETRQELVATMEILSEVRAIEDSSGGLKVIGAMGVVVMLIVVMSAFVAEGITDRYRARRTPVTLA